MIHIAFAVPRPRTAHGWPSAGAGGRTGGGDQGTYSPASEYFRAAAPRAAGALIDTMPTDTPSPTGTPSPAAPPSDPAPASPPRLGRTAALVGLPLLALLGVTAFVAQSCESTAGGRVHSALEYRRHVAKTKQAGMDTVARLRPAPALAGTLPGATLDGTAQEEHSSPSCVDDLGFDDGDVTRDQPGYSWRLRFEDGRGYRSAVEHLRAQWKDDGLTVTDVPAPDRGQPGEGLPGVRTTDHGIELSLQPDRYTGHPTVYANGSCMRHHEDRG